MILCVDLGLKRVGFALVVLPRPLSQKVATNAAACAQNAKSGLSNSVLTNGLTDEEKKAVANAVVLPLTPLLRKNRNQAAAELSGILREKQALTCLFGVARGGACEAESARRVGHFASLLDFDGTVAYEDESFSSFVASELVKDGRDGRFDSVAACEIARRFLARFS